MQQLNNVEEQIRQYKTAKKHGDKIVEKSIRERIVLQYIPMVYKCIDAMFFEMTRIREQDKEDMKQEAIIALMEAIETYDDQKLARFNTYAYVKVQFKMLDWMERNHLIRIPPEKQRRVSQYYAIIDDYKRNNNDREPSDEYIKKMMNVDDNTYRNIIAARDAYVINSIDDVIEHGEETIAVKDTVPDKRDCYDEIMTQINKNKLYEAVMKLENQVEREVLVEHYFNDVELARIAEKRGVSPQRISYIKKKALEHLAEMPEVKNIAIELKIKPLDY